MNPAPLRVRIFAALTLSPMTMPELARCLDKPHAHVSRVLHSMVADDSVWVCGHCLTGRRRGGPVPRVYAASQVAP